MLNKQDFLNAVYQDIEMVRGDTLAFNFSLKGLGAVESELYFTCKEHYEDSEALFSCMSGYGIERVEYDFETDTSTYAVWVDPVKTEGLDLDRYYYDLELRYSNDVITLMRGRLTLLYDVTKGA